MLRVIELFSGIGAQSQALKDIGIDFKTIAISEIDNNAIKAYNALHGSVLNLGDIRDIEKLPECDLLTYSFPCQDLSLAGYNLGLVKGKRSSLLWDVGRLLNDMAERGALPEYLLMENVDAITNKRNVAQFKRWIQILSDLGYVSSYAILNAKDYGIPQNRKRCFMVSSLTNGEFIFPKKTVLETRLKDMLELNVSDSYYLSEEKISKYEEHKKRQIENNRGFGWRPIDPDKKDVSYAVTTNNTRHCGNFIIDSGKTKNGYMPAYEGDGLVLARPTKARGTVQKQTSPTLTTVAGAGVVVNRDNKLSIRYLTPVECLRLMGFKDGDIEKIKGAVDSKTALYKMAGNSIVVNCLSAIFEGMFIKHSFKKGTMQKSLNVW